MNTNKKHTNSICGIQKTCTMGSKTTVCPWHKFKKMEMEEIISFFKNANGSEVEQLMLYSKQCKSH